MYGSKFCCSSNGTKLLPVEPGVTRNDVPSPAGSSIQNLLQAYSKVLSNHIHYIHYKHYNRTLLSCGDLPFGAVV
jgi:hypothetical protein